MWFITVSSDRPGHAAHCGSLQLLHTDALGQSRKPGSSRCPQFVAHHSDRHLQQTLSGSACERWEALELEVGRSEGKTASIWRVEAQQVDVIPLLCYLLCRERAAPEDPEVFWHMADCTNQAGGLLQVGLDPPEAQGSSVSHSVTLLFMLSWYQCVHFALYLVIKSYHLVARSCKMLLRCS